MSGDNRRGFHRLIEAGKGVGQLAKWLASEDVREQAAADRREEQAMPREPREPSPVPPARSSSCPVAQDPGWRCVIEGPHPTCVLERSS